MLSLISKPPLSHRLADGSVLSSLHCMNDPQPEGHMASHIDHAQVEAHTRTAEYRRLFARAALMTPKAIAAELEAIRDRAKGRASVATLPLLESELRHMRGEFEAEWEERSKRWEAKLPSDDEVWQELRRSVAPKVAKLAKLLDRPIDPGSPAWNALADRVLSDVQGITAAEALQPL